MKKIFFILFILLSFYGVYQVPFYLNQQIIDEEEESVDPNLKKLQQLISAGDAAEAFFLARSLFTSGDEWAEEWMLKAQEML